MSCVSGAGQPVRLPPVSRAPKGTWGRRRRRAGSSAGGCSPGRPVAGSGERAGWGGRWRCLRDRWHQRGESGRGDARGAVVLAVRPTAGVGEPAPRRRRSGVGVPASTRKAAPPWGPFPPVACVRMSGHNRGAPLPTIRGYGVVFALNRTCSARCWRRRGARPLGTPGGGVSGPASSGPRPERPRGDRGSASEPSTPTGRGASARPPLPSACMRMPDTTAGLGRPPFGGMRLVRTPNPTCTDRHRRQRSAP